MNDPLRAITQLGASASFALLPWLLMALLTHGAALASPMLSMLPMRHEIANMRDELHQYFWSEYEVDIIEDKPQQDDLPPEPTVEEPEPVVEEPEEKAPVVDKPEPVETEDDPYDDDEEPPPAPAEAADILTAGEEKDDEPTDLTRFSVVTKKGSDSTGGGFTSGKGTSKTPVHNPYAKVGGKVGAAGTGAVKAPAPKKNRSRTADLLGGRSWNCPFPAQADLEQVDRATAVVAVTVGADGRAKSVRVISDPGFGFGAAARRCAAGRRYRTALNSDGKAITATMPPVRVHFRR